MGSSDLAEGQESDTEVRGAEIKRENKHPGKPGGEGKGRPTKRDRRKGDLYRIHSFSDVRDDLE